MRRSSRLIAAPTGSRFPLVAILVLAILGCGAAYFMSQSKTASAQAETTRRPTAKGETPKREVPSFKVQDREYRRVDARVNSTAKPGELMWESGTEVELVARWSTPDEIGLYDIHGGWAHGSYYLVRHKDNAQIEGWVFPLFLWYGSVQCGTCNDKFSIRESGWDKQQPCSKCGALVPRVPVPDVPFMKPPFIK